MLFCSKMNVAMFNKKDIKRDECQLFGKQAKKGYDWWWHSFIAINEKTKEERPFFLEFFLCNPKYGQEEPIFGQLKENQEKGIRPSYLMVKVGTWLEGGTQLHRFFGWKKIKVNYKAPFSVTADDCYLDENSSHGHVFVSKEDSENHPEYMSGYGKISWDLKIDKCIAYNVGYGAGRFFRRTQLFEMFWHAQGMKTYYEGVITYNGEKYTVNRDTCYGYADKNWGKNFTSPWVWLSSNNMISKITGKKLENSVFDIGGGRPKVGPFALNRKLLSAIYYEGKEFEFNFSKFWTHTKTKFSSEETDNEILWHVEQSTWKNKYIIDVRCFKKDMLLVNYESPDGKKRHNRLWNGGNGTGVLKIYRKKKLIDEIEVKNIGCEYGEYQ